MIDLKFASVSKKYPIRQDIDEDQSRNRLMRKLNRLWQRPHEFWALRDVSFEVKRGEALGIIGHNGAGKSTILKLLASITSPSSGEITINGRIAALIEVGSGFHPELTGRENIYLSGSILGMRRAEITQKLESIIEFSGIREFIDTPVKRYSSGMYVRLGFSIAAHLEPDILLLDEVLAVGDAAFQAKCLNRVNELRTSGRTIIFISHDLNAVERMCDRVLLMQRGEIIANGPPVDVIDQYKSSVGHDAGTPFHGVGPVREWTESEAPGDELVRLRSVRICSEDGETVSAVDIRRPFRVEMTYDILQAGNHLTPIFHFFNEERIHVFSVQDVGPKWRREPRPIGRWVSAACIPGNFLAAGSLVLYAGINAYLPVFAAHISQRDVVAFRVVDSFDHDAARGDYTGPMPGVVRPLVDWTNEYFESSNSSPEIVEELKSG
jgi:lipopolysaccharide transport system ATP-binding protein